MTAGFETSAQVQLLIEGQERTIPWNEFIATIAIHQDKNSHHTAASTFTLDAAWFILCSVLVLFIHVGLLLMELGSTHVRHTHMILTKTLGDCCITALAFYVVGFALGFSSGDEVMGYTSGFALTADVDIKHSFSFLNDLDKLGLDNTALDMAQQSVNLSYFLFQWTLLSVSVGTVSGAIAGRVEYGAKFVFTVVYSILIYPIVAHWTLSDTGFASPYKAQSPLFIGTGVIDFGHAGLMYVCGGMAALIGCIFIGPRQRPINAQGQLSQLEVSPFSSSWHTLGTMFIWIGSFGVHLGSIHGFSAIVATRVCLNTLLSSATSGVCTLAWTLALDNSYFSEGTQGTRENHVLRLTNHGLIAGIVAISASCATIEYEMALVIGSLASLGYFIMSRLALVWDIDEVIQTVSIYFTMGCWSVTAAGIFSSPGLTQRAFSASTGAPAPASCGILYSCEASGGRQFGANVLYLVFVCLWSGTLSTATFFALQHLGWLRISKHTELVKMHEEHQDDEPNVDLVYQLGYKYRPHHRVYGVDDDTSSPRDRDTRIEI